MGQPRTQEFFCFALHVILDAANGEALSVQHQIGGAPISVIRLADAAGIRHGHAWKPAYVRTMNMPVDDDGSPKRRVGTLQFFVAGIGHGSAPQVIGAGMHQAEAFAGVLMRKPFQPSQAFFTDAGERRGNHLLDDGKKWPELRLSGGKFRQTFWGPKHLIGVPADPGPPEPADLIDDVRRVSSTVSQIAAMENELRRNLSQIGDNRLEGAPVAVNIRYDRDSHFVSEFMPISPVMGQWYRSRGAAAVKLAAPSKLIRKVLKLPGSIWLAR